MYRQNKRIQELEDTQPNLSISKWGIQQQTIILQRLKLDSITPAVVHDTNDNWGQPSSDSPERIKRLFQEKATKAGDNIDWFYVKIVNTPHRDGIPCIISQHTTANISFYNTNQENIFGKAYMAKWQYKDSPTTLSAGEQIYETEEADINCNHPRRLYFMIRTQGDKRLYIFNVDSYKDIGWRPSTNLIKENRFIVKFVISAHNFIPITAYYEVTNNGADKKPSINPYDWKHNDC